MCNSDEVKRELKTGVQIEAYITAEHKFTWELVTKKLPGQNTPKYHGGILFCLLKKKR